MSPALSQFLTVAIPVIVPLLIALLKRAIPSVPSVALPVLAPALGVGIDLATSYVAGTTPNPYIAAIWGSAGTGVREIYDQLKQVPSGASLTPSKGNPGRLEQSS